MVAHPSACYQPEIGYRRPLPPPQHPVALPRITLVRITLVRMCSFTTQLAMYACTIDRRSGAGSTAPTSLPSAGKEKGL